MAPLQRERASQESGLSLEQNAPLSGTLRAGSYSEGRVWGLDPSPCCSERSPQGARPLRISFAAAEWREWRSRPSVQTRQIVQR